MLIKILIAVVVFYLIWAFLLPLLPGVIHTVALVVLVIAAIVWLLQLAGISLP